MKCEGIVRAFVGVPLSAGVRGAVARLRDRLKVARARVGWVPEENLHVTMAFLGNLIPAQVAAAADALEAAAAQAAPFRCEVAGLGAFGRPRAPRVVWAGVSAGAAELRSLQAALAAELSKRGLPVEDRAYVPHVTMGRVRSAAGAAALAGLMEAARDTVFGGCDVDSVVLFRSRLEPAGAVYSTLHEAVLGGGASGPSRQGPAPDAAPDGPTRA